MPTASELAVKVEHLSITYRASVEKVPTLKSAIKRAGRRERMVKEIAAVRDVSWRIDHGTVLGVVGANGAGKSTMLRAIAGILPPTRGRIEVHGRVSTLLALGVGFNSQLTGRENVILGGLAQGKAEAEVEEKYEEIAAFADIGEFMDMPMKSYSSGMYQRLAFSVGVHMDPDILLVDEALSAGDAAFKRKAARKMDELCRAARTIILVSHGMASVREMANHCLWLHKGKLMDQGEPEAIIAAYMRFLEVGEDAFAMEDV
ncbi:ABC transporter ATP-binding protein [Yinghuangia seranimata]|uniref:ABC transporter ATP-binding protein n=1 Tax=Yinghuangia seranimata TaxID=408067 RepID=UPI00248CA9DE|nr:ABC transporter ATP-binding protein [Yinghuangia seranimata]MDI2132262.1 ABC transporter ATP-binding protein [Yinghuangia seranimata]